MPAAPGVCPRLHQHHDAAPQWRAHGRAAPPLLARGGDAPDPVRGLLLAKPRNSSDRNLLGIAYYQDRIPLGRVRNSADSEIRCGTEYPTA